MEKLISNNHLGFVPGPKNIGEAGRDLNQPPFREDKIFSTRWFHCRKKSGGLHLPGVVGFGIMELVEARIAEECPAVVPHYTFRVDMDFK